MSEYNDASYLFIINTTWNILSERLIHEHIWLLMQFMALGVISIKYLFYFKKNSRPESWLQTVWYFIPLMCRCDLQSEGSFKPIILVVCRWHSSPILSFRTYAKAVHNCLTHSVSLDFLICFQERFMKPIFVPPLHGSLYITLIRYLAHLYIPEIKCL